MLLACIVGLAAHAQNQEPCAVRPYLQKKIAEDYNYQLGIDRAEMAAQKWLKNNNMNLKAAGDKIVIPVVFHVVYDEDSAHQNLEESIILQQLELLNRDFNRDNKDTSLTRAIFDSIATDTKIVFELASTDPDGNPSNGITRTATEVSGFDIFPFGGGATDLDAIKSTADGGKDAWDTEKYLNIWLGRLTVFGQEGLYGFATFPLDMPEEEGGDPEAEANLQGVVVHYPTVGFNVENGDTLWRGRTLSHEVGHYLGLRHIWADEQNPFTGAPGNCEEDDFVFDTPMANISADFECDLDKNNCSNENEFSNGYWGALDPPDMIENFMDYANEPCQNMFSYGQFERASGFLNTSRKKLWEGNENGSEPTDFKAWLYTENATVPCKENCNGQIIVNFENENGALTYLLDGNPVNGPVIENVCQGIHSVEVSDAMGNTKVLRTYVSGIYSAPEFTSQSTNASCASCPDGSATVNVISGNEPISISWETTPVVQGPDLSNVAPGVYYYNVTDGCGETYRDSAEVGFSTGIANYDLASFTVAPNPVSNTLKIVGPGLKDLNKVQVLQHDGKKIKEVSFALGNGEVAIDLSSLTKGLYILQLSDSYNSSVYFRIEKL